MTISAFLLIVSISGIPLFTLPMSDVAACQANAKAMLMVLKPKINASVHCFDQSRQFDQEFSPPAAVAGETVE